MQQTATLNEKEIYEAIFEYASKQVNFSGMSHKTDVIAGRGERGLYAVITLEPQASPIKGVSQAEYVEALQDLQEGNLDLEDEGVPVEVELEDTAIDPNTQVFG
jgi:hypothetical protein